MNIRVRIILLAATLAMATTACDSGSPDKNESPPAKSCPGATQAQADRDYHPRVLKGRVMAPHAELASSWTDIFVSTAHAAPLEDEQPVADATVELYRIDRTGEQVGDTLQTTETNTDGEWCLGLPDGIEPGHDLMLRARGSDATLRRLAISEISTDLYTGTEAIVRLLQAREVDFHAIPEPTYLNMESVADTAVDLLEPVSLDAGDDIDALVTEIQTTLTRDARFSKKLESLPRLNSKK